MKCPDCRAELPGKCSHCIYCGWFMLGTKFAPSSRTPREIEDAKLRRSPSNACKGCGKLLLPENAWMTDGCPCNSPNGCNDPDPLVETKASVHRSAESTLRAQVAELESALAAAQEQQEKHAAIVSTLERELTAVQKEESRHRRERDALRAALEQIAKAPTFLQGGDGLSGPCVWCEMSATKLVAEEALSISTNSPSGQE